MILPSCGRRHRGHLSYTQIDENACKNHDSIAPKESSWATIGQAEEEVAANQDQLNPIPLDVLETLDLRTRKVSPM